MKSIPKIFNMYFYFLLLLKYNCLHSQPTMPPHPSPPPTLEPTPFGFVHVFLTAPPIIPYYPSPPSSLVSQIVLYFNASGCIFLACLFC